MQIRQPTQIEKETRMAVGLGAAAIIAGGLVAAVNSAAPFAHGSWLAAYLVLVAGSSQLFLALGCQALASHTPTPVVRRIQVVGWNAGNVAVAAGALTDTPLVVVIGSSALLVALGSFALCVGRGRRDAERWWAVAYQTAVAVLVVSVAVGCVLAGSPPS